jgi:hypothetical protein
VDAWCIWNEPNLQPRFWATSGTREQFFDLTKAAAAAIRAVDPDAVILGGAFNTLVTEAWINGLFTSGAMEQVDAIAYHPYGLGPDMAANLYRGFQENVSKYGFGDKIWITEIGFPTYTGSDTPPAGRYGTDVHEDNLPETVMQTIMLLAVNGAQHIFWYHLFDPIPTRQDNGDSEDWFGLIKNDFTKKNGAYAYQLCTRYIPGTICKTPERDGLPVTIQAYYFEGSNGTHALVVWNEIIIPREVQVYLPGTHQKAYDLSTGKSMPIGETTRYALKPKDGVNQYIQFFTWENADSAQPPRISAP